MLLREKDKNQIIFLATQTISHPFKLLAFGSRVNGDAHDTSDLDLVLVSKDDKAIDIDEFITLKDKIVDSSIPILIELFDWRRIPESFHKNILKNNELIVEQ